MSARGCLTDEVQAKAKEYLDREITVKELRLYPYLDYVLKNSGKLEPDKMTLEEMDILFELKMAGEIDIVDDVLWVKKDFYDYIQEILWLSYALNHLD